ncbi:MAG TPA: nuclear transport factor 2 family protein [Methylomirabilota bacterium]|jgi:ketosteroid isomerase-like protein
MTQRREAVAPPIAEPITGKERLGDLTEPTEALAQFYRGLNSRDLDLLAQNWDQSNEATMDNPLGGIKRGWEEIRSVYERIFRGPGRLSVEFHDYTLHVSDSFFYPVGRERGRFESGSVALDLAIRTTRVFRRVGGGWRQVHHHGSIEDPAQLAAYQRVAGAALNQRKGEHACTRDSTGTRHPRAPTRRWRGSKDSW